MEYIMEIENVTNNEISKEAIVRKTKQILQYYKKQDYNIITQMLTKLSKHTNHNYLKPALENIINGTFSFDPYNELFETSLKEGDFKIALLCIRIVKVLNYLGQNDYLASDLEEKLRIGRIEYYNAHKEKLSLGKEKTIEGIERITTDLEHYNNFIITTCSSLEKRIFVELYCTAHGKVTAKPLFRNKILFKKTNIQPLSKEEQNSLYEELCVSYPKVLNGKESASKFIEQANIFLYGIENLNQEILRKVGVVYHIMGNDSMALIYCTLANYCFPVQQMVDNSLLKELNAYGYDLVDIDDYLGANSLTDLEIDSMSSLVALYNVSFEELITTYNVCSEDRILVKIAVAKKYYQCGFVKQGDKLLSEVEKYPNKTDKIKEAFKEVRNNKTLLVKQKALVKEN